MSTTRHYYGGDAYAANIIMINPELPPDDLRGVVDSIYDFNNKHITANDLETLQAGLPADQQVTLLNPETHAICLVSSDGIQIRAAHRLGFEHLWRRHHVSTPLEPEQASLLVHERDYLNDQQNGGAR